MKDVKLNRLSALLEQDRALVVGIIERLVQNTEFTKEELDRLFQCLKVKYPPNCQCRASKTEK